MLAENLISPPEASWIAGRLPVPAGGVKWANPLEQMDWDRQLGRQNHPDRSFFHGRAWAAVLADTYGYQPIYLMTGEPGAFHSLLPFMEVRSALTGKRAIGLPFTDTCEPLCAGPADFKELFRNAIELAKARGWEYLEFRGGQNVFNGADSSVSFYGHTVEFPSGEHAYFGRLKSPVQRAIRKAEKSGVRVEILRDLESVKLFYSLHVKARKRHGLPPQPFSFFQNIHKHVLAKNLGFVALARWKKMPVAGAVFFHDGPAAIYKFGASDEAFQNLRANNLVFWETIRWLSQQGIRKLDLGRTSLANEGLRRFKLGWNAGEKTLRYFRFSVPQEKFIQTRDESSGWHNYAFSTLPLFASRMIGEILYRHWA